MKTKNGRSLLAMVVIIWGMLTLGLPSAQAATPAGVLKEAIHWGLSADWLDPATNSALVPSQLPLYLFHDALLKPMPEGTYTPCLAESWSVSPDSKVYEFKLRTGVKFHNGDLMTAEDVIFSFWRYKAGQAKIIHGKTEKVEAVNPHLIRFHFKESFPDFLEYLLPGATTIGWVVPKKYVEKVGEAGFKKHPIGAGPYKFVEFVTGVRLVGEAFEDYWRKVPHIKRIEFHIISEPATRLAMARRGEVDIATLMQGVFYEDLKKDPKLRMVAPLSPTRWLVYLTSQWDPRSPWSDPRVRKAASLAIDRKTLADVHMPGCGPVGSLGLEGDPMALDFPPDPYNPEGAKVDLFADQVVGAAQGDLGLVTIIDDDQLDLGPLGRARQPGTDFAVERGFLPLRGVAEAVQPAAANLRRQAVVVLDDLVQKAALVQRVEQPEAHALVEVGALHHVAQPQNVAGRLERF